MANGPLTGVLCCLRRAALLCEGAALTDGDLLDRYLTLRDPAAFEALLKRHGAMVLGVCRRVLRNEADAQDAFQATFLVFLRKADSIEPRTLVGNWLYGVAYKTSLKAKAMSRRRKALERLGGAVRLEPAREQALRELRAVLDRELSRLPDKYRAAVVLCELEGKSLKEAAGQLACPAGTVASRLARGRGLLARRLARQGLSCSGGILALALARESAASCVPGFLYASTVQSATALAAGQATAAGVVSSKVVSLSEGVLNTMLLTKLKVVLVSVTVCTLAGSGSILAAYRALGPGQPDSKQTSPAKQEKSEKPKPDQPAEEKAPPAERTHGYLGVMLRDDDDGRVIVHEVFPDSPAAKAGVKAEDVLLKVAGKEAKDPNAAVEILRSLKPGDKVTLTLKRDDKEKEMTITLGKWPANLQAGGQSKSPDDAGDKKERGFLGLNLMNDDGKVVVQDLYPDSPAAKAGVKPGDVLLKVNDVEAKDDEAVVKQMSNLKVGDKVTLRVKRGDKEMDVKVTAAKRPEDFGKM